MSQYDEDNSSGTDPSGKSLPEFPPVVVNIIDIFDKTCNVLKLNHLHFYNYLTQNLFVFSDF
jgi:hypothetical protein